MTATAGVRASAAGADAEPAAVQLSGVVKHLGGAPVLRGVDLELAPGSLTAVLGPSGCGKTTLLRVIAGFLSPDAGTVRFGHRLVAGPSTSVPTRERDLGYVPQEGALFPHLTVGENVTFGLPRSRRRDAGLLAELLDLVELPSTLARRHPHELSGGQQQRVAVARALARRPSLVLLDEPFSALDAGLREQTGWSVQRALRASGATSLLVTHDQGQALSLADVVAVMRDGLLIQVAAPSELYRAPADPQVADFVGGGVLLTGTPDRSDPAVIQCALGPVRSGAPSPGSGSAVQVLVRPEQIEVTDRGEVVARVGEVRFYGAEAAILLQVDGHDGVITTRLGGAEVPAVGSDVRIRVRGTVAVFPTGDTGQRATGSA